MDRGANGIYQLGKLAGDELSNKAEDYGYDANGNLIYVLKGTRKPDSTLIATNSRKLLWDEENRLLGINDNGFVSNYWYDASGERTVKESFDNEGVQVNGKQSAARTGTSKFTAYISPYLVVSNGGNYTKHIYMGSQRITSKVSNSGIFTDTLPVNKKKALAKDFSAKFSTQTTKIKERFDTLGVAYKGIQQNGGLVSGNPVTTASSYFYHSDHLGSSSLITDGTGALVQHIEYVPFGETFLEERNGNWHTPYLFNGKERDEETGLHYYSARYYDSRTSVWLSVDPLAEKNVGSSSYVYCANNPIMFIDPTGMDTLLFNSNNKYSGRIESKGEHVGKKTGTNGFIFKFADPINDPKNIGNKPGQINELYIMTDEAMLRDLNRAGVNKSENRGPIDGPLYMLKHSHAGHNSGELDFVITSEIFGFNTFGDEKLGRGLPDNYLYITKLSEKTIIGHNSKNFGNFLWGASAKALYVNLFHAQYGAHINNMITDPENYGKPWSQRKRDSRDDQFSITMGYAWRSFVKNSKK